MICSTRPDGKSTFKYPAYPASREPHVVENKCFAAPMESYLKISRSVPCVDV